MKRSSHRLLIGTTVSILLPCIYVLSYAPVYLSFTYDVFGVPKSYWPAVKGFYQPVSFLQSSTILHDPLMWWFGLWCDIYLW